jgi:hypothetical protein
MHWTALVFCYYSLLNVCDFNATEIFIWQLKGGGGQMRIRNGSSL